MRDLDRQVVRISVPALAALVVEPVVVLTDTAVVGRLGTTSLAGLAAAGVVLTTLVGLCVFLAYGTTAVVARADGAGHRRTAAQAAIAGLWLAVGLGVLLALVVAIAADPLAAALTASTDSAAEARRYLLASAPGIPAMLVVLAGTGALRGRLDLRTPLLIAAGIAGLNVVTTVTLVIGADLGITGAGLGTSLAQWAGGAVIVGVVSRQARESGAGLRPQPAPVLRAARQGVALLARTVFLRAALLIAVALAAASGDATLAAHQIVVGVVMLLSYALDALAIAGQTLTGRALGAGDAARARAITGRLLAWGAGAGAVAGLALVGAAPWLGRLFSADTAVLSALPDALLVVAVLQPVAGLVFVLDGILIGAGDARYLAFAGALTLAAYLPLAAVVSATGAGLVGVWLAYGGFLAARLLTLGLRARGDAWLRPGL